MADTWNWPSIVFEMFARRCNCTGFGRSGYLESSERNRGPHSQSRYLICFALPEEKRFFKPPIDGGTEVLVTGMGPKNAVEATEARLSRGGIGEVLTCGFAGGLDPTLRHGDILWNADDGFSLLSALKRAERGGGQSTFTGGLAGTNSVRQGRFYFAAKIAVTAAEKARLRSSTGADAVEMESEAMRAVCHRRGIPSATLRVISDVAEEDLPLDFNSLANARQEMNYLKLLAALARHPTVIPRLMRFHSQITMAARALGSFLDVLLQSNGSHRH